MENECMNDHSSGVNALWIAVDFNELIKVLLLWEYITFDLDMYIYVCVICIIIIIYFFFNDLLYYHFETNKKSLCLRHSEKAWSSMVMKCADLEKDVTGIDNYF